MDQLTNFWRIASMKLPCNRDSRFATCHNSILPGKDFSLAPTLTGITYTSEILISFRNVSAIDFNYLILDYFSMNHELPLEDAQALAKSAELELDPIIQDMKYLDSILLFLFCGHLIENNGTRERAILKIYNDTFDFIK